MRMSDWSSDVCSSDLLHAPELSAAQSPQTLIETQRYDARLWAHGPKWQTHSIAGNRKSGVWGRGCSVRVDLGGRPILIKTTTTNPTLPHYNHRSIQLYNTRSISLNIIYSLLIQ